MKRPGLSNVFLVLLVLLALLSIYFSFVKPIRFSHLIQREGVSRYAEVEILLPDDVSWMRDVLPPAEESRNVFGQLDWQIVEFGEEALGDRKITRVTARVLIVEESSGILRYGKYTLVRGNKIFLINDRYFIEGRILDFRLLDEKIKI